LARHRCYTKEPLIRINPILNDHFISNDGMRTVPSQMIGMPLFFNFYGGFEQNNMENNIFGYLRRFEDHQFHF
jgi:hypothetical protein